MPAGLTLLDCAVLGAFLSATVAVGTWAGRRQSTSDAFLLADRSLPWWPVGISLAAAGFAAVWYCGIPNEAYWAGTKFLLVAGLIWAALPIVCGCVIPLYGTLELESVFEYLELRFNPTTRAAAGGVYVVGMVFWLGGVLVLPCAALGLGGQLDLTVLLVVVSGGVAATLYTYLGGMRATVWTDVGQFALMAVVLIATFIVITANLGKGEGLSRIWEVAEELDRTHVAEAIPERPDEWAAAWKKWSFWSAEWSIWAVVPYLAILPVFFFVADQSTLQRIFATRDNRGRTFSFFLGCGLMTLAIPLVTFLGMGLLAVYHDNAQQEMSPAWVVNSATDPDTGRRLVESDVVLDEETAETLVSQRAILDPNTDRPFTRVRQFLNSRSEPVIDALATRAPRRFGGERLLRSGGDELFGRFVRRHLLLGLVLAALLGVAMATIDSGVHALVTLVVVDFHRRFGWGERSLARRCGKLPDELDQQDELRLARPMVLVFGSAVIVVALVVAGFGGGVGYLLSVLNLFAGPLLGVFLLGLFTRRATASAVLAALASGILTSAWATFGHLDAVARLWPLGGPLGPFWPLPLGLAATLLVGYLLGFVVGSRKSRDELTGLVFGLGRWGHLLEIEHEKDEVYWIEIDDEESPGPWA